MEADESMNELVKVDNPDGTCTFKGGTCWYMDGRPGHEQCKGTTISSPCHLRDIIFLTRQEYLTWKLTQ